VVRKREVMLGRREPGFVEVTNGLVAGNRVVVEGTLKLRDGDGVREVGAAAPAAAPARPATAAASPAS
jgi:membrane fusion protein (multidrug efflux system)